MQKKKLSIVITFLLLFALLLAGCGGTNTASDTKNNEPKKTDTVVVGVYGGDWEKNIRAVALDQFAKETGIKVEVVAGADAEWYTKLQASKGKNPPYDLLILTPDTIQKAISSNLLQPIEAKKVPNVKDLYQSVQEQFTVDGKQYAAGFSMGQLGIAYRKDLVPTEPKKWMDLWNPEYKGHVAISSPTYAGGLQFFSAVIHSLGGDEKNPKYVDKALDKLAKLKENVSSYPDNPGSIQTLLERGDAWVVPFWDGRVFALQDSGIDLGFVYPEEGAVSSVASWAVMKGSQNELNAYKLLDYLLSPEVQKEFSDRSYYGMTNKNVEYSDKLKEKVHVGEEEYKKLKWVDYKVATPNLADWTNRWTEKMGGGK
jgi:putative spermidine/putrescine transport system substrate-binding protein